MSEQLEKSPRGEIALRSCTAMGNWPALSRWKIGAPFASVVNWGEVYYNTMREVSPAADEQKAQEIAALPIEIVGANDDLVLTRQAAIFKASHRLSCADALAAALAKLNNADLVTGDPEFKAVEKEIRVRWLS